jgi:phage terminase Nu1 subunit (DNA packaging protein)
MDLKALTHTELCQLLNHPSSTIYNYQKEEIPIPSYIPDKGKGEKQSTQRYDWYAVLRWYLDRQKRKILDKVEPSAPDDIEAAKCRKLVAEAGLAELDLLAAKKLYIKSEDAKQLWVRAIANSRAKLLLVPITAAKRIYPEMELSERESVIAEVIHNAMYEMASLNIEDVEPEVDGE